MRIGILAFLCVLLGSSVDVGSVDDCNLSPINNCPLYSFKSDIVTNTQMTSQNVTDRRWLMIYYSQFDPHQSYGKCYFRWHTADSNDIVRRNLVCYNIDTKSCESYEDKVKRKEDTCGRVEENGEQITLDAKFYSQDLSQYFWYDACYNYTASGDCEVGYLDLLVREDRYPEDELDLQGLPWHLISADLKNNFNMDISDEKMKFSWKGPECGSDGSIKTNGASQRADNYFALLFTVSFTLFLYI